MATGLLLLLDDIASILDDVAALTKVSVHKTAGVLGDDLALNANQVAGVLPNRELPIVWAVAKGSLVNKAILVPGALLLSAVSPWAITPLLIVGGTYLCFEGFEKIVHKLLHSRHEEEQHHQEHQEVLATPEVDVVAAEKEKISGAVRTDFILSAEIIVITLGIVNESSFIVRCLVLVGVGILMTIGVYGLVAGIVKMDDLGAYWAKHSGLRRRIGQLLLLSAPWLMKFLSVAGTAAMFLVGGGILVHKIKPLHHYSEVLVHHASQVAGVGGVLAPVTKMATDGLVGILAGAAAVLVWTVLQRLFGKSKG